MPIQERSKKRVEAILDAAAASFAEVGFESATTEGIAEKAGTSIGSVYQFYPNKLALFEAVAARAIDRSREAFDALFASAGEGDWTVLIDFVLDGLGHLQQSDPTFRALVVNFQLYGVFEKADVELTRYFIDRVDALLKKRAIEMKPAHRRVVATTVVNVISGVLFLLRREESAMRKKLTEETKVLLKRYLEPYAKNA